MVPSTNDYFACTTAMTVSDTNYGECKTMEGEEDGVVRSDKTLILQ